MLGRTRQVKELWFAGVGPNSVYVYTETKTLRRAMDLMLSCGRKPDPHIRYSWGPFARNPEVLARDLLYKAFGADLASEAEIRDFANEVVGVLPPLVWSMTQEQICDWWIAGVVIVPDTLPQANGKAVTA